MKVLLVEDNENDVALLRRALVRNGVDVRLHVVWDETGLRCALAEGDWAAVISDFSLPRLTGLDVLRIVREDDEDVPFILVSGVIDTAAAVNIMRAGAQDYLMKDDLERIPLVLEREVADGIARRQRREEQRLSAALDRINATIHSTLDSDEIVRRVMVAASEALHADAAALAMRSGGEWVVRYVVRLDVGLISRTYPAEMASGSESAARGRSVLVLGREDAEDLNDDMTRDLNGQAVVYVPLLVKDDVGGVLTFVYREDPQPFSCEAAAFAERLASSVSLALENARLYEAQQRIAETLQQSLLALPSTVEGVKFAHRYSSATDSARVGGDFYDIYELEPGVVALAIGDVSGKGIEAASLTALLKNVMRSHTVAGDSPCEVMAKTNQIVHKFTPLETFATSFCAKLDRSSGRLDFCCAGHPVPMIVRRDGSVERLTATNRLVGAFPGLYFDGGRTVMQDDEFLLMYTDGLIEARRNGVLYGQGRLEMFLGSREWPDVETLVDSVLAELRIYAGGKFRDDLALLAVCLDAACRTAVS